jgi:molecular chaperone DnaJ
MLPSDGVLVVIQHKPHDTYKKLTRTDIMSTIRVDALDAMLGTQVSVRTLAGEMKMKVPAGTQPGTRLRIANAGLNSRDGRKGDHIVLVEISIPRLTTEQQRVIREMRVAPAREKDDGYENE